MRTMTQRRRQQQQMLKPESDDNDTAQNHHKNRLWFDLFIDQDDKRYDETNDKNGPGQLAPGYHHGALNHIVGFFWNIAVPDDRQLNIEKVSPQQAKRKKQFADIVEMGWL